MFRERIWLEFVIPIKLRLVEKEKKKRIILEFNSRGLLNSNDQTETIATPESASAGL